MLIQNTSNGRITEYTKFDDILEDNIKPNQLNSSQLEQYLMKINKGSKRRIKNNHELRLKRFKAK